jgi:hypothetical protein
MKTFSYGLLATLTGLLMAATPVTGPTLALSKRMR